MNIVNRWFATNSSSLALEQTSIGYSYDDLGRLIAKDIPGSTNHDVAYGYDLLGRAASVDKGGSGSPYTFVHDALGRMTSQTQYLGTTSYTYDAAGRRASMAYPGGGLTVNYDYDVVGNVTKIRENGATSDVGVLATYAFDDVGRRSSVTFGNGSVQSFTYDATSRLDTLTNNLGGSATTHDLAQTFTYNPAGQISSVARSNDAYAWAAHYNIDRAYIADGLNRIMSVGSTSFGYDARGNLTSDGTNSYTYNSENMMTNGPGGATFKYDALGRLQASNATGAPFATRYEYDGADLITEFDAPSTILRRYVHGPGTDNPIAWYEGSAISNTTRRFLMTDERGSVVSITDSAGATIHINAYDEYGIPAPGNIGRFGYTGQTWLSEIGMWYYKARLYSPTLGRFMQTDPIGYADGMNWYNYVGSDPVNFTDAKGTAKGTGDDSLLQYEEFDIPRFRNFLQDENEAEYVIPDMQYRSFDIRAPEGTPCLSFGPCDFIRMPGSSASLGEWFYNQFSWALSYNFPNLTKLHKIVQMCAARVDWSAVGGSAKDGADRGLVFGGGKGWIVGSFGGPAGTAAGAAGGAIVGSITGGLSGAGQEVAMQIGSCVVENY